MKNEKVISFLSGLIYTIALYAGVYILVLVIAKYFLNSENYVYLQSTYESIEIALYFYLTLFITGWLIYQIILRYKTQRWYSAAGISISLVLGIFLCVFSGEIYIDDISYHQDFNKVEWIRYSEKPYKMAKTLAKSTALIGLTKEQVSEKIGFESNFENNIWEYSTDYELPTKFCIEFKNNKVIHCYLYETEPS